MSSLLYSSLVARLPGLSMPSFKWCIACSGYLKFCLLYSCPSASSLFDSCSIPSSSQRNFKISSDTKSRSRTMSGKTNSLSMPQRSALSRCLSCRLQGEESVAFHSVAFLQPQQLFLCLLLPAYTRVRPPSLLPWALIPIPSSRFLA